MAEEVGIGWKVSELLIYVNDSGSSLRKPVQYADDTKLSVSVVSQSPFRNQMPQKIYCTENTIYQ